MRIYSRYGQATAYFNGLGIKLQSVLFVDKELLHVFTLVALELNHFSHFGIVDDGAIAC